MEEGKGDASIHMAEKMMSHCNQLVGESYGDEGQKTGGGVEES
jgi:hypothetical protein